MNESITKLFTFSHPSGGKRAKNRFILGDASVPPSSGDVLWLSSGMNIIISFFFQLAIKWKKEKIFHLTKVNLYLVFEYSQNEYHCVEYRQHAKVGNEIWKHQLTESSCVVKKSNKKRSYMAWFWSTCMLLTWN